jgi:nucleoside-diphosphate-sugar epimerase
MRSDCTKVLNIGSEEMISINDLAKMVIDISGKNLTINNIEGPTGVRGRNSDNTLIKNELSWSPTAPLKEGMIKLYEWINQQVNGN